MSNTKISYPPVSSSPRNRKADVSKVKKKMIKVKDKIGAMKALEKGKTMVTAEEQRLKDELQDLKKKLTNNEK